MVAWFKSEPHPPLCRRPTPPRPRFTSLSRGEQLGRDGSVGVYGGKSPYAQKAKLWTAGTAAKGGATGSSYELVYSGDRVVLNKDGKVGARGCPTHEYRSNMSRRKDVGAVYWGSAFVSVLALSSCSACF